jgi:hypothetical protein
MPLNNHTTESSRNRLGKLEENSQRNLARWNVLSKDSFINAVCSFTCEFGIILDYMVTEIILENMYSDTIENAKRFVSFI